MTEEQKKPSVDKFEEDWARTKEYWKRQHLVYDFAYLQYRSILTFNSIYGADYLNAFGMKVFVPYTFQTIASISSTLNGRKVEFLNEATNKKDEAKEKYLQQLDNIEWKRAKVKAVRADVIKDALIYGNGYYFNPYLNDKRTGHFAKTNQETETKPQDPEDGEPQEDEPKDTDKIEWKKKDYVVYQGMKPRSLDPYYTFPDIHASSDEDWDHCYTYTIMSVEKLRRFAVQNKWMTEAEAETKIVETPVEYFDDIRNTIDFLFQQPLTVYTRGDHQGYITQAHAPERPMVGMTALIERFESDSYEARIAGSTDTLYKDYNVYPHKQIPIVPVWDEKVPHVFAGMGEPELMRWQQIEGNRVHNSLLEALLLSVVQRYAIRGDLLEDESDVSFQNPFKPIRLKKIAGNIDVRHAIMPMPQPDIKQSPFELINLIKETIQQTTGASDFVVSASDATTGTATESNNLMAATTGRMREKTRQMDEHALPKIVEQWHANYPVFYTDELDFRLTGEKFFVRYIPLDRNEANENQELIDKASKDMDSQGSTLVEVYQNAGYNDVIFLSDVTGTFTPEVQITELDLNSEKKVAQYMNAIKTLSEVNKMAGESGEVRRFDVFKLGEEMLKEMDIIRKPEEFIVAPEPQMPTPPMGGMPTPPGAPSATEAGAETGAIDINVPAPIVEPSSAVV